MRFKPNSLLKQCFVKAVEPYFTSSFQIYQCVSRTLIVKYFNRVWLVGLCWGKGTTAPSDTTVNMAVRLSSSPINIGNSLFQWFHLDLSKRCEEYLSGVTWHICLFTSLQRTSHFTRIQTSPSCRTWTDRMQQLHRWKQVKTQCCTVSV